MEKNDIAIYEYDLARAEFDRLKRLLAKGHLKLKAMTMSHFELLTQMITTKERRD